MRRRSGKRKVQRHSEGAPMMYVARDLSAGREDGGVNGGENKLV